MLVRIWLPTVSVVPMDFFKVLSVCLVVLKVTISPMEIVSSVTKVACLAAFKAAKFVPNLGYSKIVFVLRLALKDTTNLVKIVFSARQIVRSVHRFRNVFLVILVSLFSMEVVPLVSSLVRLAD